MSKTIQNLIMAIGLNFLIISMLLFQTPKTHADIVGPCPATCDVSCSYTTDPNGFGACGMYLNGVFIQGSCTGGTGNCTTSSCGVCELKVTPTSVYCHCKVSGGPVP